MLILGKQMPSVWQCLSFGTYSFVQMTEWMPGAAGRQQTDFSSRREDELAVWWGWTWQRVGGFGYLLVNAHRLDVGVYVYMSPVVMELSHLHPSPENPCIFCKKFSEQHLTSFHKRHHMGLMEWLVPERLHIVYYHLPKKEHELIMSLKQLIASWSVLECRDDCLWSLKLQMRKTLVNLSSDVQISFLQSKTISLILNLILFADS